MTLEYQDNTIDYEIKKKFRNEFCNVIEMSKSKVANVPKGYEILRPLQSEEEFNKILGAENWAVTQTKESNILFFDLDHNNSDPKIKKFFNRRRDKYINNSELINSKHGFLKVADADHNWCVGFADKYHLTNGIEIYAEKHWVIFAGKYYNSKNKDNPERITMWYSLDDLHIEPIMEITKSELGEVFDKIPTENSINKKTVKELYDVNFVKTEGENRGFDLLRVIASNYSKNKDLSSSLLFALANQYNLEHFNPPYDESKVKELVKQGINYINEKNNDNTRLNKNKDIIDKTADYILELFDFQTIRKTNEVLIYTGKIYNNGNAESIIREETEKKISNCTTNDRNEVVNKIKAKTGVDLEDFDNDPYQLTLENGILHFDTLELREHTSDNLSCVLIPVEFQKPQFEINDETIFEDIEKNLKNTLYWKFLKSSFTVDGEFRKENFETILEEHASFFIKRQIDEKAFMQLGKGDNGKSVFLEYVENMIGLSNRTKIPLQDLAEDKFMCANLQGMLANIFPDLESHELKHSGKLKSIVSNEGIEVQKKHKPAFTLQPFCKLMFSCNRFPKVYDQTQGFFRRWMIVKWERDFENDSERDPHLKDKLKENQEEKNLVFSSLVYLAKRLLRNGKFTHSKKWEIIAKEWISNADPLSDFIDNYILESDGYKTVRETYHFYREIMLSKQENPLGIGQFSKAFREYYDQERIKEDGRTERVWLNIGFKRPVQASMEDFER